MVGILAAIAIPSFYQHYQRHRILSQLQLLESHLKQAQGAAISAGANVMVCGSDNGKTCQKSWSAGYLAYLNSNTAKNNITVLFYQRFSNLNGKLIWRSFPNQSQINFTPDGFVESENGSFTFVPDDKKLFHHIEIVMNKAGRVRMEKESS